MKDESVMMRGMRRGGWAAGAVVAAVMGGALPAAAETRRVAVVVGHNTGGATERPLRYAEEDAAKMADVLVELGEVSPENLFLLRGRPVEAVVEAMRRATAAVQKARKDLDDRVVLTFFFSGHSDAGALQLGNTRLGYAELKKLLAATGAEVRLTIIDGCKSGSLVAAKGGRPGPAFEIGLADQLMSVGEATLTSSAADEASLESSEIRGSFFTHHLVSGLRGAADVSGDGRVTLSEAYEYAFNRTVVASAAAGGAPQHPNYEYQLSGGGELVLTRVGERTANLQLPAGFSRALVVNVLRDQVIAELSTGDVRTLAVAPGEYGVRLWKDGATWLGRVKAPARTVTKLDWTQLRLTSGQARQDKGMLPESRLVPPRQGQPQPGLSGGAPLPFPLAVPEEPLPPAAQELWNQMVLSVGEPLASRQQLGTLSISKATYVGTRRREITTETFLRVAGRKDLASQIENRRALRYLLVGGGAALALGGVVYGYSSQCDPEPGDPDFSECLDSRSQGIFAGTFMVLGGVGAMALGSLLDDNVPESHVLRGLADQYNRSLRSRLLNGQPLGGGAGKAASLRLSPAAGPAGGALIVSGSF